ncbi:MAG: hypothetical protein KGM96_06915 [Acidobacteriota bacterium]|nr:hypothetical protein [Acidobacteriota bacterium]
MMRAMYILLTVLLLTPGIARAQGQNAPPAEVPQLAESGQITMGGNAVPYLIRRLPISSFPALPAGIQDILHKRGCMIPQTYQAHRPENVVRASLERAGSSDWAVLCAANGTVSLLVFLGSAPGAPIELASAPETERLQPHDPSGVLGFNWGIDPATPEQVHDAQSGMEHRAPPLDHEALADSIINRRTVYHFYTSHAWIKLETPD